MTMVNRPRGERLKIAYLCIPDPLDKRSWSGTTYYIGQTLQKNIGDVDFLGPVTLPSWFHVLFKGMAKLTRLFSSKEYYPPYSLLQNWYGAWYLKKKMKGRQYDLICAPASCPVLGYFDTDLPVVHVHDATIKLICSYYPDYRKISGWSKWQGEHLEKKALKKSSFIIYSSQWAAHSAIEDYHVPQEKFCVMPLGANMDFVPGREMIFEKEKNTTLTILYLAVEWERKGGAIAFDTLRYLRDVLGIPARLIVCGCVPPEEFAHPDMEVIPFLNKNKPEDHERFVKLLSFVHFLILPTRADCSLLVPCESNAYGVPAIVTNTGGVPDIVKDGVNGYCLPYEAGGPEYGKVIAEIFADKERYHKLVASSRQRYEDELNWDKWADRFREIVLNR